VTSDDTIRDPDQRPEAFVGVDHWEGIWANAGGLRIPNPSGFFAKHLKRFLPVNPEFAWLEIGCFPGTYMVMANKTFGYRVEGLDYVREVEALAGLLEEKGVVDYALYDADFFDFPEDREYDIVASFGFVEHFEDTQAIIDKHAALTAPGGYVVINIPNFNYGQRLLQRVFAPDVPETHNTRVDIKRIALEAQASGLDIIYSGYVGTFFLFVTDQHKGIGRLARRVASKFERLLDIANLDNIPNRWFSPYAMVIARKPRAAA